MIDIAHCLSYISLCLYMSRVCSFILGRSLNLCSCKVEKRHRNGDSSSGLGHLPYKEKIDGSTPSSPTTPQSSY